MRVFAILSLAIAACEASEPQPPPLDLPAGCNPLMGGVDCFLPYPSDVYLVPDSSLPSGKRVEHTGASKLMTDDGQTADFGDWRPFDGFSKNPTIMFSLGTETSMEGMVRMDDALDGSQSSASKTLLIEAETGRLVAHFVDEDPRADDPNRVPLLIRPMEPMQARTRYVVAVKGLVDSEGVILPAPEGFRRLRDKQALGVAEWDSLAERYESAVFPVLETAGLDRSDLQLAWDFTTGSDEQLTDDMFAIRDLALEWTQNNDPVVSIRDVIERDEEDRAWRIVRGDIEGPLYMERDTQGAAIHRNELGQPSQNGTAKFRFIAVIPRRLINRFEPGRVVHFGHGFFGSPSEVEGGGARGIAEATESVFVAIRWKGMAELDAAVMVADMADNPPQLLRFGDRVHQAMANWIVTSDAVTNVLHMLPAFQRPTEPESLGLVISPDGLSNAGQSVYDPSFQGYVGISQGHILGGVLAALNPHLSRMVLNVGGAAFTHMMSRAGPFNSYLAIIETVIQPDPFERQKILTTMARVFDRFDPATYAPYVLNNKLPGSPEDKRVLLQVGYADAQVPDFASYFHARLLGVPLTEPTPMRPWGLDTVTLPMSGSAMTLFEFPDVDDDFRQRAEPTSSGNKVHEAIRRLESTKRQIDAFLKPGDASQIIHPCDGPCDPE